ncbi:50S ribosomal protein L11 methyltransferase [Lentilactobacillus laojiaonis]|uniref:50S ribosomal protein L11 methyltransferase n=1 Tax=Lentilactobacillus laojiaonis TaxID=2883998 RepID=UPI001D0BC3DD|nr:50S ribosomal protein L11 methyltransferase [Lentilactobacillus laojiaonis]UDM31640.1 50S ribosomal protein L11 methyltransferase [Lentilactobacillus laojiaonis]
MKWTQVSVLTTSESIEAVSNIFMELGAEGVAIEDSKDYEKLKPGKYGEHGEIVDPKDLIHITQGALVSSYFPDSPDSIDVESLVPKLEQRVIQLKEFGLNPGPAEVKTTAIKDEDWSTAWERYYHPVRITHFITIVPSWEDYKSSSQDEKVIRLNPGMAFGTGTHPTTRLSLQALETVIQGGENILDVGTGSGVLSISAKLMGANNIKAFDVDEVAVESAQNNLDLNPVAKDIEVSANDLLKGINENVDVVVANILAEIIIPLVPQAWDNLKEHGYFITSGIINDKIEEVKAKIEEQGFIISQISRMKDWYSIIAIKPGKED